MLSLVVVDKGGDVKTVQAKSLTEETIYKKCNYRKPDNFDKQHTWNVKIGKKKYNVSCYGKKVGKANMENKYDFPPPLDSTLFYGNCALVSYDNNDDIINFTKEEWEKIYEKLFGGFEDLGGAEQDKLDEEMDKDELKNVPKKHLTKEGYLKDGFVVDKDVSEDESYEGEEDESQDADEDDEAEAEDDDEEQNENVDIDDDNDEDEEQSIITKKKKNKKIVVDIDELSDSDESYVSDNDYVSDLGDELSEDDYEYSDEE